MPYDDLPYDDCIFDDLPLRAHCIPYIAVKKFHGLTSFLLFPETILRLPVTLPILGTLDSNIHRKTFAVTK